MKKLVIILTVAAIGVLVAAASVQAAVTFKFDPNDLIELWEGGAPNPDLGVDPSDYPRSIYDPGVSQGYTAYTGIGSWNTAGTESTLDKNIGIDFNAWRNDNGGFITSFNIWLADNPRARGWGETLVIKPNTGLSATADAGGLWQVEVSTNEWHSDLYYAQWWTEGPANAIKIGGTDIGEFSFSATLYVDANENGWDETDPLAEIGEDYTIWFGGYGVGDDDFGYEHEYYGTSANGLMYQGTLDITAIPEPGTMIVWGLLAAAGWLGMGVWRRGRGVGRRPWSEENRAAIGRIIERH